MTKIKLCGLTRPCDIQAANELRPDFIGFVFAPGSRRYVSFDRAAELRKLLDPCIQAVGVFVDEDPQVIAGLIRQGVIDIIQLHGREDEDYIRRLRQTLARVPDHPDGEECQRDRQEEEKGKSLPAVIQAFSLKTEEDVQAARESGADWILLDSGGGGTGKVFDWSLLSRIGRPYFLAGGLSPGNAGEAVMRLNPFGVDVSSGIETEGYKDRAKMKAFVREVRRCM